MERGVYSNTETDTGYYLCGEGPTGILVIVHRHHWLGLPGRYLLTMGFCKLLKTFHAVMDDFGDLVIVDKD